MRTRTTITFIILNYLIIIINLLPLLFMVYDISSSNLSLKLEIVKNLLKIFQNFYIIIIIIIIISFYFCCCCYFTLQMYLNDRV